MSAGFVVAALHIVAGWNRERIDVADCRENCCNVLVAAVVDLEGSFAGIASFGFVEGSGGKRDADTFVDHRHLKKLKGKREE